MRIGIAFSGGGVRGVAHIGVVKALEEAGLEASVVAGTSAGSIAASMYAAGMDAQGMLDFVKSTSFFKFFKPELPYGGLIKLTYLKDRMKEIMPVSNIEDLSLDTTIVASNLHTGECAYFQEGPIDKCIVASCAIPLIFKPIKIGRELYLDGGILNNLPADAIRDHCDLLLGINVMPDVRVGDKDLNSVFGIATRAFELSVISTTRPHFALCDVVIEPAKVRQYSIFQLGKYQEIYEIGYQAAQEAIPNILNAINSAEETG